MKGMAPTTLEQDYERLLLTCLQDHHGTKGRDYFLRLKEELRLADERVGRSWLAEQRANERAEAAERRYADVEPLIRLRAEIEAIAEGLQIAADEYPAPSLRDVLRQMASRMSKLIALLPAEKGT